MRSGVHISFFLWVFFLLTGNVWSNIQDQFPVNKPVQPWQVSDWLNSKPKTLEDLRGRVVLVRWWTAPSCPFCSATAPALNEFYETYHGQGLEVLGFYHHKARTPLDKDQVADIAKMFGFEFPVAIDHQWNTLKQWWLYDPSHQWTSVSFLIDKQGLIRYVHPGGQYVQGDGEYEKIKEKIEKLLKE